MRQDISMVYHTW